MIVDEPYTINERFGDKYYEISVDSPDFNGIIPIWSASCRVSKVKKIEKLREEARKIRERGLRVNEKKWTKLT